MSLIRWNTAPDSPSFPWNFADFFPASMFDFRPTNIAGAWVPRADVAEHDKEYVVTMELPGISKDQVAITMQDNVLTIRGEKKSEEETRKANYRRVERSFGTFERAFTLPDSVNASKVEAAYKDGVLRVTVPKAEVSQRKLIEVQVK